MKPFFLSLIAAVVLSANTAQAAVVQFAFEAEFHRAITDQSNPNLPDFRALFSPGDVIQGTFSYDTDQIPTFSNGTTSLYETGLTEVTVSSPYYSGSFSTAPDASTVQSLRLEVSQFSSSDVFGLHASKLSSSLTGLSEVFSLNLSDNTQTALSNNDLPSDIDFATFSANPLSDTVRIRLNEIVSTNGNFFVSGKTEVIANITSLQKIAAVPIPGSSLFFLTGLTGIGLAARKKSQAES